MNATLTDQQRQALQSAGGGPLAVIDEQTNETWYLVSAAQLTKLQALLATEDFDPRELYPLTAKTAAAAGWDDSSMDVYDRYDEHRK